METFTDPKPFVDNPHYRTDRQCVLKNLDPSLIDDPLVDLIENLNNFPYLFTLQCCYGHFLTMDGKEILNLERADAINQVEYKLAYIAFCIEKSPQGKDIAQQLENIPLGVDQDTVQFCSAQWFWDQWVNSYALQVMPRRFQDQDSAYISYHEAREIGRVRDAFYIFLKEFITKVFSSLNIQEAIHSKNRGCT